MSKNFGDLLRPTKVSVTVVSSGQVKIICLQFEVLNQSRRGGTSRAIKSKTKKGSLPIKRLGNDKVVVN